MRLAEFSYTLPPDRIAQIPTEPRDASRLLVVGPQESALVDAGFRDLPRLLAPGDLVVVNDTRVIPARLWARKSTGGRVEVLLLEREGVWEWEALLRSSKKSRPGSFLDLEGGATVAVLEARGEGRYRVRLEPPAGDREADPAALIEALGEMPLPPYICRAGADPRDRSWYQTLFADPEKGGSAAAPTAGLHFTPAVRDALTARGVGVAALTLHVGLGTFLPVRSERLAEHRMHREWFELPEATAAAVNRTLDAGHRVVAVGTTTTRVLEHCGGSGRAVAQRGYTELFLKPGHPFRLVGGLLTNFHLPESTLLVLVCAFGGRERMLAAYRHAVAHGYRFYSYGDAMLVLRDGRPAST